MAEQEAARTPFNIHIPTMLSEMVAIVSDIEKYEQDRITAAKAVGYVFLDKECHHEMHCTIIKNYLRKNYVGDKQKHTSKTPWLGKGEANQLMECYCQIPEDDDDSANVIDRCQVLKYQGDFYAFLTQPVALAEVLHFMNAGDVKDHAPLASGNNLYVVKISPEAFEKLFHLLRIRAIF